MSVKGVLYIDKKGREGLYVPNIFIVINYTKKEPEIILEPEKLKKWFRDWEKIKLGLEKVIDCVEIDEKEIELITKYCFNNEINKAKWRCVGIFDQLINKAYGIN